MSLAIRRCIIVSGEEPDKLGALTGWDQHPPSLEKNPRSTRRRAGKDAGAPGKGSPRKADFSRGATTRFSLRRKPQVTGTYRTQAPEGRPVGAVLVISG